MNKPVNPEVQKLEWIEPSFEVLCDPEKTFQNPSEYTTHNFNVSQGPS